MDPVTHGLIGASASLSLASKEKTRMAALTGAVGAMLPDLDVFIDSASDPLLQLEFHRQFSHALLFVPVGALITSLFCWWFVKRKLTFKETYLFSLAGTATAGLADTFTSYGVQLLWPFTTERFAWNLISVFDPLFTLGIIIFLGIALFKKDSLNGRFALGWVALYLFFGWSQLQKARQTVFELAMKRDHNIQQLILKPTIANELLWSIRYVSNNTLYANGVRLTPFTQPKIYKGQSIPLLDWQLQYDSLRGTTLYNDISRFADLSDNVLILHPDTSQVIGDGRYAMLPTSVEPLWGIQIDTTQPDRHVEFKTYRDANAKVRTKFINMILGK
jgi:inner membrane protein